MSRRSKRIISYLKLHLFILYLSLLAMQNYFISLETKSFHSLSLSSSCKAISAKIRSSSYYVIMYILSDGTFMEQNYRHVVFVRHSAKSRESQFTRYFSRATGEIQTTHHVRLTVSKSSKPHRNDDSPSWHVILYTRTKE